jgi:DnaK suppressor protein
MTSKSRREFIVKAREHLKSVRAALIHELASDVRAELSVSSGDPTDSADLASAEYESEMSILLSRRGKSRIGEIDCALRRMDEANYGVCETCGLEITEPRLKAMPYTQHCCDCQQDQEREAKVRPRSYDIEQERFKEFGSVIAEDDINQKPMRRPGNETHT